MTPSQKLSLEKMFIEAVQAYLFPILESDTAAYKMVADELKKVLEVLGYSELQIKQLIKNKKDFIIDMTNFSTKARRRRLSLLTKDYKKEAKVFIADSKTIFERNENREGKTIKKEVIESMMNGFMLPTFNEFDSIELFVQ